MVLPLLTNHTTLLPTLANTIVCRSDPAVKDDMAHWPFKVVAGPGDKPMVEGAPRAGTGGRAGCLAAGRRVGQGAAGAEGQRLAGGGARAGSQP